MPRKAWPVFVGFISGFVGAAYSQPIPLVRTEVAIDFKDEGYYKSIPFISLEGDRFYISDNFKHRILAFRLQYSHLEFIRAIGRAGQGPGDLMSPMDISASNDVLAVRDQVGISFFDPNGGFRNKFPLLSRSVAMEMAGNEIYSITYDPKKPDLVQVYSLKGGLLRSLLDKEALFHIRSEIHRGFTREDLERNVFTGLIRTDGKAVYYLSQRFGEVFRLDPDGLRAGPKSLAALLDANEKAKAKENRRMFLEDGYDLDKNQRRIPHNYLFEDARISDGRLYLLLESYDLSAKKMRPFIEFVEIDLDRWVVLRSFRAEARVKWESASQFVVLGSREKPVFLTALRAPKEDETICLLTPERQE